MARMKRSKAQREADLITLAEGLLSGRTQTELARELGVSNSQVCYDVKKLKSAWRETYTTTFDEVQNRELAKLDLMEREAWSAFRRSRGERSKTTAEQINSPGAGQGDAGATRTRAKRETQERDGDPRWLDKIEWAMTERAKRLGLYAPEKHAFTDPTGRMCAPASVSLLQVLDVKNMTIEELDIIGNVLQRQVKAHSETDGAPDATVES